jgi:hypothetical protein
MVKSATFGGSTVSQLDFVLDTRLRDDHLGVWQATGDFLPEPLDSAIVTMDEESFFRRDFEDVI